MAGFIHDELGIKMLILFIMQRLPDGVELDTLADLTLCDEGINYFDFAGCLAELCETGHLSEFDGSYTITDKGRKNGKVTENSIPYSVRIKAEKNAKAAADAMKARGLVKTSHAPRDDGCLTVSLSLSDGISEIINLDILAGTEEQAVLMEKRFRRHAERIYNEISDILLYSGK